VAPAVTEAVEMYALNQLREVKLATYRYRLGYLRWVSQDQLQYKAVARQAGQAVL
jgi:hypothetical protein